MSRLKMLLGMKSRTVGEEACTRLNYKLQLDPRLGALFLGALFLDADFVAL